MPIVANQQGPGKVVIRATANEDYIVAGNTSVSNLVTATEIANANGGAGTPGVPYAQTEVIINSAHIAKLAWTTGDTSALGNWQILRSNTSANVLCYSLVGNGVWDLEAMGISSSDPTKDVPVGNLHITFAGSGANGTLIVVLKKNVNFTTEY